MITQGKVEDIRDKQKNKCNICKFPLEEGKFHVDHINPKSKGGDDGAKNLQILCIPCHSKKNKKDGIPARYPKYILTSVCDKCGKVVGGYTQKHVNTLMAQHMIKHDNEDIKNKETVSRSSANLGGKR